ncbi:MAG: hypothetical protein NZ700_11495 [Gemmataceae bacterium]|nr:hypothetical protein [Gemmataceae bacterium]MDW8265560.1 hypothetical protein [Gemmataceae bacterium]
MTDPAPLSDVPRQRLRDLLSQYGRSICEQPARLEKLLKDLCGECRREVFVLMSAVHAGVVAELLAAAGGTSPAPLLTGLAKRMHTELSLAEDSCQWAVEAWAEALGIGVGKQSSGLVPRPAIAGPTPPTPTPEQRRIAAAQFERANQALKANNPDYAIQLLMACCKLDPGNLVYRQLLRKIEKIKYKDLKPGKLSGITSTAARTAMKAMSRNRDYAKILEEGEEILSRNPWDVGVQLDMAEAADQLGLLDVAIWILEQARERAANDLNLNRALARLYEKRGNYGPAIALWEMVRQADPKDMEARHKAKDLAAAATIVRGSYEEGKGGIQGRVTGEAEPAPASRAEREAEPLKKRLAAEPTNATVYLQLAQVYRRHNDLAQARAILQQGLGATGNDFQIMVELAELDIEPFRLDLAVAEEKLKADPQNPELRQIRKNLLREINSRELSLYRQKADRFPQDTGHRLELGIRLLRANQIDEAIKELQLARSDPRQQWRALMYLGYCFKARNNWRLAQRNFEDALKALPPAEETNRKEILFQLAQGCADANDLTTAIDLGHELANLDFTYRNIGQLLDEWQKRLEQG